MATKTKKVEVRWITVYGREDEDEPAEEATGSDSAWEALVIDGEMVAAGDYYHDHISDYISGYLDCFVKTNKNKYTKESFVLTEEDTWGGAFVPDKKKALYHEATKRKYER